MTTVCTPYLGYLYSFIFNTKTSNLHFVILERAYLKSLEYFKDHLQYILLLKKSS